MTYDRAAHWGLGHHDAELPAHAQALQQRIRDAWPADRITIGPARIDATGTQVTRHVVVHDELLDFPWPYEVVRDVTGAGDLMVEPRYAADYERAELDPHLNAAISAHLAARRDGNPLPDGSFHVRADYELPAERR